MKKLIFLFAITGFFMQSYAQKLAVKDVPEAVTIAFYKTYPAIQDVDWSKDGFYYQASYTSDDIVKSATYDVTGKLINTRMEIVSSALPAHAMEYVRVNYKADKVKEAFMVTDVENTVTYVAEVKGMELTFDSKGNFINASEL